MGLKTPRHEVVAQLTCGHEVREKDLTRLGAERTLATMSISAWCERCGRFSPTKTAHVQPPLY